MRVLLFAVISFVGLKRGWCSVNYRTHNTNIINGKKATAECRATKDHLISTCVTNYQDTFKYFNLILWLAPRAGKMNQILR